ncbi:hypothetical protein CPB84DRAFT_1817054 [Gymnopilus junonius]|uniref:Malate dehydrogenase n=1 Tax=Gymnopilus junonius TaxID=109634 RepID=A0A9P5NFN8_GYMJU|nr:hypothetical protein CPB84DRAFT_1817054 [Gymnopilus junonius]
MAALHDHKPAHLVSPLRIALRGQTLLTSPRYNKGTAFPSAERKTFEQCERAYGQLESRDLAIRKNTFLQSLKEQNLTLYYACWRAEAITSYSQLFRRSEGLFLSFPDEHIMEELFLEETRGRDIELIVVTDGEAILGIGDQGVGISTAKSVIYTLIGGMEPAKSLPVVLDVGTDNQNLLNDPLYVIVQLVRKHYPKCLLHFEDFGVTNARRLLDRYRDTHRRLQRRYPRHGAVTLACIMSAIRISSLSRASASSPEKKNSPTNATSSSEPAQRPSIATQLRDAIISADGLSRQDANRKFWLIDRDGLLHDKLRSTVDGALQELWLKGCARTVLIGCSTKGGAFTKEVVEAMMRGLDEGAHPIILPLSNPSRLAEATPEDLMHWTKGRALIATGSPFENVKVVVDGKEKEFVIAECLGFGAVLSKSRSMTDTMLIAGAKRLAALSPALSTAASDDEYNGAALLPDFVDAPKVNFEVAITEGTASEEWVGNGSEEELAKKIEEVRQKASEKVWIPVYPEYIYDEQGIREV